jgi:hypothetical protein
LRLLHHKTNGFGTLSLEWQAQWHQCALALLVILQACERQCSSGLLSE